MSKTLHTFTHPITYNNRQIIIIRQTLPGGASSIRLTLRRVVLSSKNMTEEVGWEGPTPRVYFREALREH